MVTRKLIKPNLKEIKKNMRKEQKRKPPPPYKTHAENYYFIKQMNNRTPMIVELVSNEKLKGTIEWYDDRCIKVKTGEDSNLIIYKHFIKYMYKDPEYVQKLKEDLAEKEDSAE